MAHKKAIIYIAVGIALIVGKNRWDASGKKGVTSTNPLKRVFNASGTKAGSLVVGGYNSHTNMTYVFPEGHTERGHWVKGSIGTGRGSRITG